MNGVIFTLEVVAIAFALDATWLLIRYMHRRRIIKPPMPDTLLPLGYRRMYADGRGNLRSYEWTGAYWRELPGARLPIPKDEPADS